MHSEFTDGSSFIVAALRDLSADLDLGGTDGREIFRSRVEHSFRLCKTSALRRYVILVPALDEQTRNRRKLGRSKHEVLRALTDRFEDAKRMGLL